MTVAPPLSRLHLVPALVGAVLLCLALAWPVAAKRPEDKGPPPGQAKKAAAPGQAKKNAPPGQAKKATPPGQAKKATPPGQAKKSAPAGQAKKATPPGQAKKATPPGQAKKAAPPATSAPAPGAGKVRGRAAARRRAATASRRAAAGRRARRVRAERRASVAALLATPTARAASNSDAPTASSPSRTTEDRAQPRKERSRPPLAPVTIRDELPQPLRVVRDIVEVVPTPLRVLLAGLVALSILLAAASGLTLLRNRRLAA